jgi:hypothetical protein
METKQYITLEVAKGDFNFVFQMPSGATWGSAIDAAFDVLQKLNELSQQSVQNLKPADQSESGAEESPVVEPELVTKGE